jgi:hypothetical protein
MKRILINLLIIMSLFGINLYAEDYKWELSFDIIDELNNAEKKILYPEKMTNYKNFIMDYIVAIDKKFIKNIKILRVFSTPVKDFFFFKDKFYSVIEDWGKIDKNQLDKIKIDLKKKYGEPKIQRKKNLYIYSYFYKNTNILLYKENIGKGFRCKIYYYTKNFFRMLFLE